MKNAVVVDCLRTPIGRAHPERGWFRDVRSDDLAVEVVKALVERSGVDAQQIEDLVMGNTQQQGEQGFNVALYWENESPEDTLSFVPTSAITGEGLSDLIF